MTRSAKLSVATAILFVTLWALPVYRAILFLIEARKDYDGSMDRATDIVFSDWILITYAASLLCCLGLAWLLSRRSGIAFLFPIAAYLWKVGCVIYCKPEEGIVIFPTIDVIGFACFHLAIFFTAALFFYFPPRKSAPEDIPI